MSKLSSKCRSLRPSSLQQQRGTVLLTVVLIAAFIIVLVVEATKTVTYQKILSSNLINRDQAYSYLMGMEELAKIWMKKSFDASEEDIVHLGQSWAQDQINFPIDGGGMQASIKDMQSCFNLNSIVFEGQNNNGANPGGNDGQKGAPSGDGQPKSGGRQNDTGFAMETPGQLVLEELIEKIDDKTDITGKAIATAVRDWIDEDIEPAGPDGAEDSYYQGLEIPYRTANDLMAHVSELRTVKDVSPVIYELLRPLVCVLPDQNVNQININTVTEDSVALLLANLGGQNITLSDVTEALAARPEEGFESVEAFIEELGPKKASIDANATTRLSVTSEYFEMRAKAEVGKTRVYMKTLFKKDSDNNFKVVSRYFGRE
ncbi:type II secretion system minor pseudopilin GspK [Aliikangiella sp. IMCC44653]